MRVLVTGSEGRVASGIKQHLDDGGAGEHEFVYLDREDAPDVDYVADVAEYDAIRPAFDDVDAVVHLAADPSTAASWESVQQSNIAGTRNVLEAAADAEKGVEEGRWERGSPEYTEQVKRLKGTWLSLRD